MSIRHRPPSLRSGEAASRVNPSPPTFPKVSRGSNYVAGGRRAGRSACGNREARLWSCPSALDLSKDGRGSRFAPTGAAEQPSNYAVLTTISCGWATAGIRSGAAAPEGDLSAGGFTAGLH